MSQHKHPRPEFQVLYTGERCFSFKQCFWLRKHQQLKPRIVLYHFLKAFFLRKLSNNGNLIRSLRVCPAHLSERVIVHVSSRLRKWSQLPPKENSLFHDIWMVLALAAQVLLIMERSPPRQRGLLLYFKNVFPSPLDFCSYFVVVNFFIFCQRV